MRKSLSIIIPLSLSLAACAGPSAPSGPDPLTLSFTGTGTMQNWTPNKDFPLTHTGGTQKITINVGTLKADKSVAISMTPEQAKVGMRAMTTILDPFKEAGCTLANINIVDTNYRLYEKFDLTGGTGKASYTVAQTLTKNANGVELWDRRMFFFSDGSGNIRADITCKDNSKIFFNFELKPGWNIVHYTFTYDPATSTYGATYYSGAEVSNSYSGAWYVYAKN